jgi:hypothetical protein
MSNAVSDHTPPASALPARLVPSGPGKISGKIVRMVACHMDARSPACPVHPTLPGSVSNVMSRVARRRGCDRTVDADLETPLIWIIRDHIGLTAPSTRAAPTSVVPFTSDPVREVLKA